LEDVFSAGEHVLPRGTDPHMVSSFMSSHAYLKAAVGRYADALAAARRCEQYAVDVRLPFVVPHARRVRAMAELGLRQFPRCKQTVDWLTRTAATGDDVFLQVEARLLRARLLLTEGLAARAIETLRDPPERFPFAAERGEYLATQGLALACLGHLDDAESAAREAEQLGHSVEIRTLASCVRAVLAILQESKTARLGAIQALQTALTLGNVDSFVVAYRSFPPLLAQLRAAEDHRDAIAALIERAQDWDLARAAALNIGEGSRTRTELTPRELEVLSLIAEGLTNREIAAALFISQSTAKVHTRHILEKLGVRTRTEAALRAADGF